MSSTTSSSSLSASLDNNGRRQHRLERRRLRRRLRRQRLQQELTSVRQQLATVLQHEANNNIATTFTIEGLWDQCKDQQRHFVQMYKEMQQLAALVPEVMANVDNIRRWLNNFESQRQRMQWMASIKLEPSD